MRPGGGATFTGYFGVPLRMRMAMVGLLWLVPGPVSFQDRINTPVITNLKIEPSSALPGVIVMIRIQIFDRQGQEDIVPILYLLREGLELIRTPLYDDGTCGDSVPMDGFYTGRMTVPLTASVGSHWFVVYIYDKAGHRSNLLIYEFWVPESRKHI